ncbi:MAG: hypothetical protein V3W35_02995, partial [Gemmatimonadota bacterium]
VRNPRSDRPYPKVAPIAISQGVRAAANIENDRAGRPAEPYAAHHAGTIVSVGAGRALVDILGLRVVGRPAWLIYRTAYILKMVGLRNKLQVAFTLALNRIFERDLTTVVPASSANGRPTARDGNATGMDGGATGHDRGATGVASREELV